jgi:hypothetical protein
MANSKNDIDKIPEQGEWVPNLWIVNTNLLYIRHSLNEQLRFTSLNHKSCAIRFLYVS